MSNFYTETICKDARYHSIQAVADLDLLEPVTRAAVQAIVSFAARIGHNLVPVETYRSVNRQQYLFSKGATELRAVGVHHYGLACDLAKEDGGHYDPDGEDYLFLRSLAEQEGLISGIDWGEPAIGHTFRDWDHVQRVSLKRQAALFEGTWYPDTAYRPLPDCGRATPKRVTAPPLVER